MADAAPTAAALVPAGGALSSAGAGDSLPFSKCAFCFDELAKPTKSREERLDLFKKLLNMYGRANLYPLVRILLPHLDTERKNYDLKEAALAKLYVEVLQLQGETASEIIHFKRPNAAKKAGGDLAERVHLAAQKYCRTRGEIKQPLTIRELHTHLDALAGQEKRQALQALHERVTALETKWIIKIILKDLGTHLREAQVFKTIHPDMSEKFQSVSDLREACVCCADPNFRLEQVAIRLFKPFKPQLALRAKHTEVDKKLGGSKRRYLVEDKYDGERCVLHLERRRAGGSGGRARASTDGLRLEFYSRQCKDSTEMFEWGMVSPLAAAVPQSVTSLILDGEMLVWDHEKGRFAEYRQSQHTRARAHAHTHAHAHARARTHARTHTQRQRHTHTHTHTHTRTRE